MSETLDRKLRGIVEDLHEEMMRSLVDAPAAERAPKRAPLATRLGECGFDGSMAVATSFQAACTRMLANGATDHDVVEIVEACLRSASPDAAVRNLERYLENTSPSVFVRTMLAAHPVLHLVATVFGTSQHLADILIRQPGFVYWLMEQRTWDAADDVASYEAWLESEVEPFRTVEGKLNAVRRMHRQALLKIGALDLVGGAPVEEVTRRLSDLAEACARAVLDIVYDEVAVDDTHPHGLAVIAMGKLGGRELNYSSDIDLIFVSEDSDDDTIHFYTKVARRFTDAINALTDEGYLYRVDLRLRPDGKAGPLVNPESSLRIYYENRGRPWEFQALLKARAIAGDTEFGVRVLETLGKLIYNPALPYSPLEAVGAMRDQIKENLTGSQRGYNIKLMAGGIRDIEFVAQAVQLMNGHNQSVLRSPSTLVTLAHTRELGLLKPWDVDNLAAAYRFFRLVEHRLQMMHQLQTHTLPDSDAEVALLARRVSAGPLGSYTTESFVDALSKHLNNVRAFADSFFAGEAVHPHSVLLMLPEDHERAVNVLHHYGIRDVPRAMRTLHAMAYGSFPHLFDRRTRAAFENLLPLLLEDVAASGDPDQTLVNMAEIAAAERSGAPFYEMLVAAPSARRLVVAVAGMSSLLTRELCAQISTLDALLEDSEGVDSMLTGIAEWERFSARDAVHRDAAAEERQTRQREWFERLRMRTFADCARGRFSPGPHGLTGEAARAAAARVHLITAFDAMIPEREHVAVFALGSYAVGEPRIASDLDLLVVADEVDLPDLAQRLQVINQWFSEGRILKLDFRLRAEGASSPLVQDMEFYQEYFRERASLWERVAFVKCAPWWGGDKVRRRFQQHLRSFAAKPFTRNDRARLMDMRHKVESLAPRHFSVWETKRSVGGRYDIEYLCAIGLSASAKDRLDYFTMTTRERVDALVKASFVSAQEGAALHDALDLFALVEHLMDLQEMVHPESDEQSEYLEYYLGRTFEHLGHGRERLGSRLRAAKETVRAVYEGAIS
jgi:[glutamine synthetase] adenylyltransferase / [glutamine synthetase]-adenylyl-L-tyrosine phosphorylase